jgi:hypothetical protein
MDKSWRHNVFWGAVVILAAAYAIRYAFELIRPLLSWACPLLVVGAVAWLYIAWRRRW